MNIASKPKQGVVEPEAMHLAFWIDNRYFRSMEATLASVVTHNPHRRFIVHVFCFSISPWHRQRLDRLPAELGASVRLHLVDPAVFRRFQCFAKSTYYSGAVFIRLLMPTILSGQASRVLYLDCDILCAGTIDELRAVGLDGAIAAVVPDAATTTMRRSALQVPGRPGYFDSGVMLMDVDRWMAEDISAKAIGAIIERGRDLRFPGLDALNLVLDGRVKLVDRKWNCLRGAPELFTRYQAMSPWGDLPLHGIPRNYKGMRMRSRYLFRLSKLAESFYCYWKHACQIPFLIRLPS